MSNETTDRRARYRAKRQREGMTQVTVWCPVRDRERVRKYAAGLTKAFEKEQEQAGKATDQG